MLHDRNGRRILFICPACADAAQCHCHAIASVIRQRSARPSNEDLSQPNFPDCESKHGPRAVYQAAVPLGAMAEANGTFLW